MVIFFAEGEDRWPFESGRSTLGPAMTKPRVFIGSATETRAIVDALESELREVAEVDRWYADVFVPGRFTLEDLTAATGAVDFAVFVLGQEDKTDSRGEIKPSPRDNVVFEAGLFTAALGRERVYYLVDKRGTKIPSDWAGLGYLTFDIGAPRERDKVYDAAKAILERIKNLQRLELARPEARIAGAWWQLVENSDDGSVVSLLVIDASGPALRVRGQSWSTEGNLVARYDSRSATFDVADCELSYYWRGTHPREDTALEHSGVGDVAFEPREGRATSGRGSFAGPKPSDPSRVLHRWAFYRRVTDEEMATLASGTREQREALIREKLSLRRDQTVELRALPSR
jgi:hypothetical protein